MCQSGLHVVLLYRVNFLQNGSNSTKIIFLKFQVCLNMWWSEIIIWTHVLKQEKLGHNMTPGTIPSVSELSCIKRDTWKLLPGKPPACPLGNSELKLYLSLSLSFPVPVSAVHCPVLESVEYSVLIICDIYSLT